MLSTSSFYNFPSDCCACGWTFVVTIVGHFLFSLILLITDHWSSGYNVCLWRRTLGLDFQVGSMVFSSF